MEWEAVIGLEVHVQLKTISKLFGGASTAYGAEPNTQACDFSIALPGVLPVMNREAAHLAVRFGLAIDAEINLRSIFARKNYFYPDLPKGYQISQFELPIVGRGHLDIETDDGIKKIGITRAHLEEDAGKSLHEDFHGMSGIDLNRAGTPLLEIVSEPDMRSASEAVSYLKKIHTLVRYLEISDGNMQEGSFRCDANVSIRPAGSTEFGTRTELKNINSFRFVEKAIEYEIERQIDVIEDGGNVIQETRLYDSGKNVTRPMRSKEEANDYRYFPDPDLPDLVLEQSFIDAIADELPELPEQRRIRIQETFEFSREDSIQLTDNKAFADYFELVITCTRAKPKLVATWMLGEVSAWLNRENKSIAQSAVASDELAHLLDRIEDGTISGKIAKEVFAVMWQNGESADRVIESRGLKQISDTGELEKIVDQVMADNAEQIEQYRGGQQKVFGYLVGQVMKATQGKANPKQINQILRDRLD